MASVAFLAVALFVSSPALAGIAATCDLEAINIAVKQFEQTAGRAHAEVLDFSPALRGKEGKYKDWKMSDLESLPTSTNQNGRPMTNVELHKIVNSTKVVGIHKLKINTNTKVFVVELENGMVGIYKPDAIFQGTNSAKKYASSHNEVVASAVDDLLGTELVPATANTSVFIGVSFNGLTTGSFQLVEPAAKTAFEVLESGKSISKMELVKLDLFDSIIDNSDRHLRNFLVRDDGSVVAIDHGRSFSLGEKLFNHWTSKAMKALDFDTVKRLVKLAEMKFLDPLTGEHTVSVPLSQFNNYDMSDVKQFAESKDGQALYQKLKGLDRDAIKRHLKLSCPTLSEREINTYSERISRRTIQVLKYLDDAMSEF